MKNLVSIIMPVYNAEKYLIKSINSVLNQTYEKFELIIVNDGSTDSTLSKLNTIVDDRVYVYTIENSGPSIARNIGLTKAKGEFIQFVDADDTLVEDTVEYLVEKIQKTDLVIGSYRVVQNDKIKKKIINTEDGTFPQEYITHRYVELFKSQVIRHLWNKIYRKDILDKYELKFDPNIKRGEGIFFNIEYLKKIQEAYLSPKILYNYYDTEDSITSSYVPNFVKDTDLIFTEIEKYLYSNDVDKKEINELNDLYAHRLMSYVTVLFNETNNLSSEDIIKEIETITSNSKFKVAIITYNPESWELKMLKALFKNKMNRFIYGIYSLNEKRK